MTAFPSLVPSSRTFTPGDYPHASYRTLSGRRSAVRNSNVMLGSELRLSFRAITEADMLSILTHYSGRLGGWRSFALSSDVLNGLTASDYTLSGYGWVYAEPPVVDDLMCGGHNVELRLISVPPEGTALVGLNLAIRMLLSPGKAPSANGLLASVTYSLDTGLVGAPGINATVQYKLSNDDYVDPDFANVSLLLHMDGSNDSTTFTDNSANQFAMTAFGNAKLTTSDQKYGSASGSFNGATGTYVRSPANSAFAFGTGDFTVEMWLKPSAVNDNDGVFSIGSQLALALYLGSWYLTNTNSGGSNMGAATANTWQHVAITRSGTTVKLFIDGTQKGSSLTWNTNFTSNQLFLGYYFSSAYPYNGLIDEFRITKGVARYTANFTAPSAPFQDS